MEVRSLLENHEGPEFTVFEVNGEAYIGMSSDLWLVQNELDFDKVKTVFIHYGAEMDELDLALEHRNVETEELKVYTGHGQSKSNVKSKFFSRLAERVNHGDKIELAGEKFKVLAARETEGDFCYMLHHPDEKILFSGKEDPKELHKYRLKDGDWEDYKIKKAYYQLSGDPVEPELSG